MQGKIGQFNFIEVKKDKESVITLIEDLKYDGERIKPSQVYNFCSLALRMALDDTKGTKRVIGYFTNMNYNGFLMGGSYDKVNHLLRLGGKVNLKDLKVLKSALTKDNNSIYRFYNDTDFESQKSIMENYYKRYDVKTLKSNDFDIQGIEIDTSSAYHGNLFQLMNSKNVECIEDPIKTLKLNI